MSKTGKSSLFVVHRGLLPILASAIACLCTPLPAANVTPDAETADPTSTLNLSVMEIPGHVEPYVDQYLLDSDTPEEWYAPESNQHAGRRLLGAEFIYYRNSNNVIGDSTELGLRTTMRQETRRFGELGAEFSVSNLDTSYIGRQSKDSEIMFTLRQTDVPVADHWTMNNTVGFQRTAISPVLNGSYRIRLPSSPLIGWSGQLINSNKDFLWFTGKTGYFQGTTMQQFREDGGRLTGGAYQQEVTPALWIGTEIVSFSGNELVREHASLLAAGQYSNLDKTIAYDFHLLADDDSNAGLWVDGMHYLPADYQLRYGIFYLQPELAWMDRPIANNQSGLYVRTDKQSYRYTLSAGYDYLDSGLDDEILPGMTMHSSFFNGHYRMTRNLTLGINANFGMRHINLEDERQTFWRLNQYLFYQFPIGTSRLEVFWSDLGSERSINDNSRQGARFSHEWRMPRNLRLTTELRAEESRQANNNRSYREAGLNFHQDIGDNWTWGFNASAYRDDGNGSSYDGIGLNADMHWNFWPDWHAGLNILYNTNRLDVGAFSFDTFEDRPQSTSFWLTVSYSKASGQPLMSLGSNTGAVGSGRVSGIVFYDENRDFIRQPGEKPAAGIVVLLDGRYEARTDSEGRYVFDPVYSGVHRVSINTDELPLPWSLYDETPRRVEVSLRRTGEADFPLVSIQ